MGDNLLACRQAMPVTLPPAPVVGDVLQVAGVGTGGWQISQNQGQAIVVGDMFGAGAWASWNIGLPTNPIWYAVASSTDGVHLVAVANTGVYTSADAGATWTLETSGLPSTPAWYGVA